MTQPEYVEGTVEWFWYTSSLLFARMGEYDEVLRGIGRNGNDEGRNYSPWRFIHAGQWATEDLAFHFYNCGLRSKQANTLFHHFCERWLEGLSTTPEMPDWKYLPAPRELFNRTKAHKVTKRLKRANTDRPETSTVSISYSEPSHEETQAPADMIEDPPAMTEDPPIDFDGDKSRM